MRTDSKCHFRDCERKRMKGWTMCARHGSAGGTIKAWKQMQAKRQKWFSVTIDYRCAAGQGSWLGSARGENEQEAVKEAVWQLRQGKTDFRVDRTQVKLSGWQR